MGEIPNYFRSTMGTSFQERNSNEILWYCKAASQIQQKGLHDGPTVGMTISSVFRRTAKRHVINL